MVCSGGGARFVQLETRTITGMVRDPVYLEAPYTLAQTFKIDPARSELLQYHGWGDPLISPYNSINYDGARSRSASLHDVQNFYHLFMVPGMNHCRGGDGTDTFDGLGALESWVEQGTASERLKAAKLVNGQPVRTRPLCPYPQVARYQGSGSTEVAANFKCVRPRRRG